MDSGALMELILRTRRLMELIFSHAGPDCLDGRGPKDEIEHVRFLATAMAGEAGEALNIIKKHWRGDYDHLDKDAFVKECADTANYALMVMVFLGRDPFEIMIQKLEKFEAELIERRRSVSQVTEMIHEGGDFDWAALQKLRKMSP